MSRRAECPECGKLMRYDRWMKAWDCGRPEDGGHGFWDARIDGEIVLTFVDVPSSLRA